MTIRKGNKRKIEMYECSCKDIECKIICYKYGENCNEMCCMDCGWYFTLFSSTTT